jgi:hypothetical protein
VTWYPDALEGAVYLRPVPSTDEHQGDRSRVPDAPDDPEDDRVRSLRRTRSTLRRFCKANGLTRILTHTIRDPDGLHDRDAMLRLVASYLRRFNRAYPAIPWAWALEWHPGGHGLHLHLAVPEHPDWHGYRQRETRALERMWGHGFVDADAPRQRGTRGDRERATAAYLAKYAAKAADEVGAGRHRYEVRQGFQPWVVRARFGDRVTAWDQLTALAWGQAPVYELHSEMIGDGAGPPFDFAMW